MTSAQAFAQEPPAWVIPILIGSGGAAVAIGIYALRQTWTWSQLSRSRRYQASETDVIVAARRVVDQLGCAVYSSDDQSLSFALKYLGGTGGLRPIVHVVMLPDADGGTWVEVVGERRWSRYRWHALVQSFLSALDGAISGSSQRDGSRER